MKRTMAAIAIVASLCIARADSLYFSSGVVTNYTNVTLTIHGPTNTVGVVEHYDRNTPGWSAIKTFTLNWTGQATVTADLDNTVYGIYRAYGTNTVGTNSTILYSTNAFGACHGMLGAGRSMIGEPFVAQDISEILPAPAEGTTVYRYNNSTTNYTVDSYSSGSWDGPLTVGQGIGTIIIAPSNSWQHFLVQGIFNTNQLWMNIGKGYSILCSPLYQVVGSGYMQVDELNTNRLGGYSLLPVQSPGYNPQATIQKMIDSAGDYRTYTLTNNVWQTSGTNTVVPLNMAEGFWLTKPTNATWRVTMPIW